MKCKANEHIKIPYYLCWSDAFAMWEIRFECKVCGARMMNTFVTDTELKRDYGFVSLPPKKDRVEIYETQLKEYMRDKNG